MVATHEPSSVGLLLTGIGFLLLMRDLAATEEIEALIGRWMAALSQPYQLTGLELHVSPSIGIAFSDQLLHGWDLARATGQDATMPEGLPEAAYEMIHGRFTDEQRKGLFKPEVAVGPDASAQDKLLAYTGRKPA